MIAPTNRIGILAAAITQSFQEAGFLPDDLLQGQIVHTDLPWQAPPLKSEATLLGLPVTTYLDYPVKADTEAFYSFYCEALSLLHRAPSKAIGSVGWRGFSSCASKINSGERLLRITVPEGFPEDMSVFAGHRFAVEAAHFARGSLLITGHLEDANNYWVDTAWGRIGIENNLPTAYAGIWDLSSEGQLHEMLHTPRGLISTACIYDVLAKVRSVLYENMERFPEFEGVDAAIMALRVMTQGNNCRELLRGIENMSRAAFFRKQKIATLEECIGIMEQWGLNDRTKISMLFERLVPQVLNMAQYQLKIINPYKVMPTVLSNKTEQRIISTLKRFKDKLEHAK